MAKSIMIQGTMSSAGKSFLCAGLCRLFARKGLRVAPFKSQNMALNSFITREGLEMGRAQVVQAEAAGVLPDVRMNPILLKPTTDMGSQVIVRGKPQETLGAKEYYDQKKKLIPIVRETYEDLANDYDLIVIEGAGSPAEINLAENDFVNMGMAKIANAPVLLVGDIDRGGVFAQLYGTIALLPRDEQERIKGVVINKFRGDKSILTPGLDMLTDRIHKPILGVLPYLDVHIEEEDSLSLELQKTSFQKGIDIAVIRLPRISNYTDFQAFSIEQSASVRYVSSVRELGDPDLIILPGTKSTIADLLWLRTSGLEAKIGRLYSHGTPVMGICGGFQMLGQVIEDPEGSEAERGACVKGMGLMPLTTAFLPDKKMTQTVGNARELIVGDLPEALQGHELRGYEIHMGRTLVSKEKMSRSGGVVWGTYLHGIFDNDHFREAFLKELAALRGISLSNSHAISYAEYKEQQFDLLADSITANLDMRLLSRIIFG